MGIATVVALPAMSEDTVQPPLKLAQQGKKYYEAGKLDKAIQTWQKATEAYQAAGNNDGSRGKLS